MGFWGSVWSGVKSVASTVYRAAKWVAKKALILIADEGHRFVDDVKRIWAAIKPYVGPVLKGLEYITATIPWLHASVKVVNRVMSVIMRVVATPLGHAIEKAVRWTIDLAKYIVDNYLLREAWDTAEQHRESLAKARDADGLAPDDAHVFDAMGMLLDFHLTRARIVEIVDKGSIASFDFYLRLQAVGKLLELAEKQLREAETEAEISADDIFLVAQGKEMLKEKPHISTEDLARLESLVEARLGKKLLPFVFQELLLAWAARIQDLERTWQGIESNLSKNKAALNALKNREAFGRSEEEEARLRSLEAALPGLEADAAAAMRRKHEMQRYAYAAEGFLIFLEKSEDQLEEEGEDYLAEAATEVGPIIIECAQYGKMWDELTEDEQRMISSFALIYEKSFRERIKLNLGKST